ncbi:AAA family ATPase [Streptomyces silvisoli]|uniref:Adenylate kinase n=1 Tax=Streptomyces silvisoli TaxID=3034235 RepID=A0ABT5ZKV9_9ACTN|nr:AAA family ATPase [Streptomyces silvisoli]MDF3290301.1 hypothetical protein [Streptomyces silvisoli]
MTSLRGRRIWLVGPSGAGKSTLCGELSERLGLPHTELDRLFWLPQWRRAPETQFCSAVTQAAAAERWIIDGQYDLAHPILRERADLVIWLDPGATVAFRRLAKRTIRRLASHEELWNANRERLSGALQLLAWALREHSRVRERNAELAAFLARRQVPCLHIRSRSELAHLLSTLKPGTSTSGGGKTG